MRLLTTATLTAAFGVTVILAGTHSSPAAAPKPAASNVVKKPAASNAALITQGKAVANSNGCNSCHTATYSGKKGFSPSIRSTGVTKQYTLATWERMMNTGVTEDGGHVAKPMPVYRMSAKDSAPLYAFMKSLK